MLSRFNLIFDEDQHALVVIPNRDVDLPALWEHNPLSRALVLTPFVPPSDAFLTCTLAKEFEKASQKKSPLTVSAIRIKEVGQERAMEADFRAL